MGATKRLCELIVQAKNKVNNMHIRFGKCIDNGSVVPLFKKQIANSSPVTVTHKDIDNFL